MTQEEAKQHIEQVRRERFWLDDVTRQPSQNPLLGMLRRIVATFPAIHPAPLRSVH